MRWSNCPKAASHAGPQRVREATDGGWPQFEATSAWPFSERPAPRGSNPVIEVKLPVIWLLLLAGLELLPQASNGARLLGEILGLHEQVLLLVRCRINCGIRRYRGIEQR